jgi:hypothetical protein
MSAFLYTMVGVVLGGLIHSTSLRGHLRSCGEKQMLYGEGRRRRGTILTP